MTRVQLRCTGSFRLDAGIRRLHRNHKFAESLAKTVALSFHHSCRSELTRQGISLGFVATAHDVLCEAGRTFLSSSACRHAVRTISSPTFVRVWRVVSEDSESFDSAFPADCPRLKHCYCRFASASSRGFSDFPAYSQIFLRLRLVNLRTVIVTAAVHRGFSSSLRLAAEPLL
jgi:hypothetical protein